MSNPDFPILVLTILSFFAGFAAAIWLAVALDRGAKEMEHTNDHAEQKADELSATNKG